MICICLEDQVLQIFTLKRLIGT